MLKEMKYLRYPISIQTFEKIIEGKYAYVDKTDLVYDLAQENVCFLSRPRRFGKSQAARMIDAYYSRGCDSGELFSKLKISESEDFEKHLNKYNVIHLDISSFADYYKENIVSKIIEVLLVVLLLL